MALGRHPPALPRLDAGVGLHPFALGLLQRTDDDVPAGNGVHLAPAGRGNVVCVEAQIFEYDGLRYVGSFAPLFVHQYSQAWFDFRGKKDRYCRLLSELDHRHRRASPLLPRAESAVPRLQQRPVGHHRVRLRTGLRGLGRPAGHGPHRRNRRARGRRRLPAVPARRHHARAAHHSRSLSAGLVPLRIRRRVQSA